MSPSLSGRFTYNLWLQLGEARSKREHLAGIPLRPATSERMHTLSLAKGVLGTTAIEGNTLSLEEVERNLTGELELPPSKQYLKQEIDNIVEACNLIVKRIVSGKQSTLWRFSRSSTNACCTDLTRIPRS